jgi:hypothetical protein
MKAISLFTYYKFGNRFWFLLQIREESISELKRVTSQIKLFLDELKELDLRVTLQASTALNNLLVELMEASEEEFTSLQALKLREIMTNIRLTLESEIALIDLYKPTEKRYDVNRLLEDVTSLFAPEVFEKLPELTQYDLNEAGKCCAFERPTATAFHILRATEGVLRHFYMSLIKRDRLQQQKQNWGPIVEALRLKSKTKKYTTLYNNLDNIRNSYRNPTQHPDIKYDIHEAQDLFGLCIEAINRMIQTIEGVKKSKP